MTESQSRQASMVTGSRVVCRRVHHPGSALGIVGMRRASVCSTHTILALSSPRSPSLSKPGPAGQPACQLLLQESVCPHCGKWATDRAQLTRHRARLPSMAFVCFKSLGFALKIRKERGYPTPGRAVVPSASTCPPPSQLVLLRCALGNPV